MDSSEEYITMCRNAVEIQNWWKQESNKQCAQNRCFGDYFYNSCYGYLNILIHEPHASIFIFARQNESRDLILQEVKGPMQMAFCDLIFLPRQDQLQEMVIDPVEEKQPMLLLSGFFSTLFHMSAEFIDHTSTAEQLWLAYVMLKKFNKWWNGHSWEPIPANK